MDNSYTSNEFLFSFEGRINRAKYWYASFASMISCFVFLGILALLLGAIFNDSVKSICLDVHDIIGDPPSLPFHAGFANTGPAPTLVSMLFHALGTPIFIAGIWFVTAAAVKRLHDRNRSGWWIVPFMVLPILLPDAGVRLGNLYVALVFGTVAFVLGIWSFVETFCLRGTRGPNRFGPDPRASGDTSIGSISPGLA